MASRGRALSVYKVTAVTPSGYPVHPKGLKKGGPSEQVKGYSAIAGAKAKIRQRLEVKRQRFDVYNETSKRFIDS